MKEAQRVHLSTDCGEIDFYLRSEIGVADPKANPGDGVPFQHGFQAGHAKDPNDPNSKDTRLWLYGAPMLISFHRNGKCTCQHVTFVQIASSDITVARPGEAQDKSESKSPFIDAPKDAAHGDAGFKGQVDPNISTGEDAAQDFSSIPSPWAAMKKVAGKPDERLYPAGTVIDAKFNFKIWLVCVPHEVLGAVEYGYTLHLVVGDDAEHTTQEVRGQNPPPTGFVHGSKDEDPAALAEYKDLLQNFPDYLPQ